MRHLTPLACVTFLVCADFADAQPAALPDGVTKIGTIEGITEYRLANGLQVLLLPDASQPKVTVNLTIFVGSRHEGYGETGMAHLLEHMVFKGCPKFPDVPKALRDHGAQFNGTTALDRTNYFETMPATDKNLAFGLELEADRMVNSFIKREDLMSEFTVVRNEFERGENDPENILSQRIDATAYEWHNYGKSTIGNRTDIERVPIDRLQAFYKKYYRPDNALLIIAGQFDAAKALALTAKFFGPIKNPADPLPKTYTEEPPQDGERLVTLRRVAGVGAVGAAYHIPAGTHPDFPACEVLEACLTDEPGGRLYKALVQTKLATSLSGWAYSRHDPGLLEVVAKTEPDKTEAARAALIDTLESLSKSPITTEEVERAKRLFLQRSERTLANSQEFAYGLSNSAGAGDWRLFFLHRDRLEKVTVADVNRAAREYLIRSNRTVGVLIPTKSPHRAQVPSAPDVLTQLEGYSGRKALAAGEAFDPTPANVEARVKRGKVGSVDYAFLAKKTRGETVNLTLSLGFGSAESLQGRVVAADVVGPMLLRGTKSKSRQQLKDAFDQQNATVNVTSRLGDLTVTVQTKRTNLPAVLDLIREMLREPSFPAEEFDLYQREQLEQLGKAQTDPQNLAVTALRRRLSPYPPGDVRYVPTLAEEQQRMTALTIAQVRELYAQQIGGHAGQLAVVGDFDPAPVAKAFDATLADWKPMVPYHRVEQPTRKPMPGEEVIRTPDKANAMYMAGMPLPVSDTDPAYPALTVGNYILGAAPLASRLSVRVRGKEGLSYGVGSQVQARPLDKSGAFMLFAITNPQNIGKVDAAVREEVARFLADGPAAAELTEAKAAYLQSLRVRRGNDAVLAFQLANALFAHRTFEYYAQQEKAIEALTPATVKDAFDRYILPKDLSFVQAGDFPQKK